MTLQYLSICSGIEAATVAWEPLGWKPVAFSEIEAFPSAVLKHHYPHVPNLGDMTQFGGWKIGTVDLLVGGTPCQSFSVAGLRKGLDDPRGNLMLTFLAIAEQHKPRWIVWENVPGVLSSAGGRDFGTFLTALGNLGYGWAYRVLDAQWFGVAQRRRRVFVVGCLGDQRRAAKVLFERESVQRNPAPSREKRQDAPADAGTGVEGGSGIAEGFVPETCGTITAGMHKGPRGTEAVDSDWLVQSPSHWDDANAPHPTLNQSAAGSGGIGASNQEIFSQRGAYLVPDAPVPINSMNAFRSPDADPSTGCGVGEPGEAMFTLSKANHHAVAFSSKDYGADASDDLAPTLRAMGHNESHANAGGQLAVAIGFDAYNNDPTGDVTKTLDVGQDYHHVPVAFQSSQSGVRIADTHATLDANNGPRRHNGVITQYGEIAGTLSARHDSSSCADRGANVVAQSMAFTQNTRDEVRFINGDGQIVGALAAGQGTKQTNYIAQQPMQVRRLTPVECERLQGFPDNYTNIPWRKKDESPDGPRYKALGNSMAVPVMRWIGERIASQTDLQKILKGDI